VADFFKSRVYRAYVLRLWQEGRDHRTGAGVWRFSLKMLPSGERRGFATLEALLAFLEQEMARAETDDKEGEAST